MLDIEKILRGEVKTSATIVPENLLQNYVPEGFAADSAKLKVLFVAGEPRKYSLTYDLVYTAMKYLANKDCEVCLRDLYDLDFDPVLRENEFYYVKDGLVEAPAYLRKEQGFVKQADILIFAYPNWHDAPVAIVKGYMEKVFAKGFAYEDGPEGPVGLLDGKKIYTLMNCGFLGGGQGYIGDGLGKNDLLWDQYMQAFHVFDEDTAAFGEYQMQAALLMIVILKIFRKITQ